MDEDLIWHKGRSYPGNLFILEKDKLYARVSSVIKPFVDFGNIPQEFIQAKAALGTSVHNYIHQEIKGEFPIVEGKERGYFQSFQKWRDVLNVSFSQSELRCYCDKKMVTGGIDALAKFHGEEKCILVDWKTSVKESPKVWPLQAHLYYYLLLANGIEMAPRFLFVKLDRDGGLPTVCQYKFEATRQEQCFQAIEKFWDIWR